MHACRTSWLDLTYCGLQWRPMDISLECASIKRTSCSFHSELPAYKNRTTHSQLISDGLLHVTHLFFIRLTSHSPFCVPPFEINSQNQRPRLCIYIWFFSHPEHPEGIAPTPLDLCTFSLTHCFLVSSVCPASCP